MVRADCLAHFLEHGNREGYAAAKAKEAADPEKAGRKTVAEPDFGLFRQNY